MGVMTAGVPGVFLSPWNIGYDAIEMSSWFHWKTAMDKAMAAADRLKMARV